MSAHSGLADGHQSGCPIVRTHRGCSKDVCLAELKNIKLNFMKPDVKKTDTDSLAVPLTFLKIQKLLK